MAEAQEQRKWAAVYGAIQLARKFVKKKKNQTHSIFWFISVCTSPTTTTSPEECQESQPVGSDFDELPKR